jgi:hypothetical protein
VGEKLYKRSRAEFSPNFRGKKGKLIPKEFLLF